MIECLRTYRLQHALDEPFGYSQWHYDVRGQLLVEIVDSDGAVGWGECYGPAAVTQTAIDSYYAPLLIGWDPLKNEAAWQHCWRVSLDFARRGTMHRSAVDIRNIVRQNLTLLESLSKKQNVLFFPFLAFHRHPKVPRS